MPTYPQSDESPQEGPPPWSIEFRFDNDENMTIPMVANRLMSLEDIFIYADLVWAASRAPREELTAEDVDKLSHFSQQSFYNQRAVRVRKSSPLVTIVAASEDIKSIVEFIVLAYGSALGGWRLSAKTRLANARSNAERERIMQEAELARLDYEQKVKKARRKLEKYEANQPKLKGKRKKAKHALSEVNTVAILRYGDTQSRPGDE